MLSVSGFWGRVKWFDFDKKETGFHWVFPHQSGTKKQRNSTHRRHSILKRWSILAMVHLIDAIIHKQYNKIHLLIHAFNDT
jgi:hypothetical protein